MGEDQVNKAKELIKEQEGDIAASDADWKSEAPRSEKNWQSETPRSEKGKDSKGKDGKGKDGKGKGKDGKGKGQPIISIAPVVASKVDEAFQTEEEKQEELDWMAESEPKVLTPAINEDNNEKNKENKDENKVDKK